MNFKDFYFGYRKLKEQDEILNYINTLKTFNASNDENIINAATILIYSSESKRSWLIVTNKKVYKIFDSKENEKPIVNWSIDKIIFRKAINDIKVVQKENHEWLIFPNRPGELYLINSNLKKIKSFIEQALSVSNRGRINTNKFEEDVPAKKENVKETLNKPK
jgi:hypothetical protein